MPSPATFVLFIHFLVVAYIVLGFPIGLILNNRKFRIVHCAGVAFISCLMILKIPCPLTVLEERLGSASMEGSFIAFWLKQFIYLPWINPQTIFFVNISFAILVFSSFYWKPLHPKNAIISSL